MAKLLTDCDIDAAIQSAIKSVGLMELNDELFTSYKAILLQGSPCPTSQPFLHPSVSEQVRGGRLCDFCLSLAVLQCTVHVLDSVITPKLTQLP